MLHGTRDSGLGTRGSHDDSEWRPSASLEVLRRRAALLADIRAFFASRGVLEVETPYLSAAAATDPHLQSPAVEGGRFLHTSPEFPMKRLLAAGSGDIWQLCRVFRGAEAGRHHNPEFTLLEWYRQGLSVEVLADEVVMLVMGVAPELALNAPLRMSYREAFLEHAGLDPLAADTNGCAARARALGVAVDAELDRDGWLDLLLTHVVAPRFSADRLTILHGYPASQAALARLDPDDLRVACRFEVFLGDLELANGFHELADADEQARRFATDNAARRRMGLPEMPVDKRLLTALAVGLPDCAGVALGVDRLLLRCCGLDDIRAVLAFAWDRA